MHGRTNHLELYISEAFMTGPGERTGPTMFTQNAGARILSIAQRVDRLDVDVVTTELSSILGATVVAVLGHATETRSVRAWAHGEYKPARADVLQFALVLALVIAEFQGRDIVQAWFLGSNSWLNNANPMLVLGDRPLEQVRKPLMAAARAFALS